MIMLAEQQNNCENAFKWSRPRTSVRPKTFEQGEASRRRSGGTVEPIESRASRPHITRNALSDFEGTVGSALPELDVITGWENRRNDPLGLNVLHAPERQHNVDIIFIHGLGGSSRHTWCKDHDVRLFWPKYWLPEEPGFEAARILSFGYNANYMRAKTNGVSNISDFAKALLYNMKFGSDELNQDLGLGMAPIVFVVHSMGGLVFKKAFMQALNSEEYSHLAAQVKAVLFLATPHRGTDLATTLNRTLSVLNQSARPFITDLSKGSALIRDLNDSFQNHIHKLQIFSFFETLKTSFRVKNVLILDQESSVLGYPGEISAPLAANHHDVCKYPDRKNNNYKTVCGALRSVLSDLLEDTNSDNSELLKQIQYVGKLLSVHCAPEDDHLILQAQRKPGTCRAVLDNRKFVSWYTSNSQNSPHQILWIHGLPGSGKSILCSFIVDQLLDLGKYSSYYYFRFGDAKKRGLSGMLRSLAYQMASQIEEYREELYKLFQSGLDLDKAEWRTIWQRVFVSCLFKMQISSPLFWILDALDEAENENAIITILSQISSSRTPIRVLIISRDTSVINQALRRAELRVSVQNISIDDNLEDIRLYARSELELFHCDEEVRQKIVEDIVARSQGNFLWTSLATQEVLLCHSPQDVQEALKEIPIGMEDMFQRMEYSIAQLKKPSEQLLSKSILMWATYAKRPLSLDELTAVLEPEAANIFDIKRTINHVCGHFVLVRNDAVTLVHQSAREYLRESLELPFAFDIQSANENLFLKTIGLFLDPSLRAKLIDSTMPTFYEYAATCWAYHLHHCSEDSQLVFDFLVKFFRAPYVTPWIQTLASLKNLEALIYAAKSLSTFVTKRKSSNAGLSPSHYPLNEYENLVQWSSDLLKIAGKFGTQLLQNPNCIYNCIPNYCPPSSEMFHEFCDSSSLTISVQGLTVEHWDDCLARLSLGLNNGGRYIICAQKHIAIATHSGVVTIWNSTTFQQLKQLNHGEPIIKMCLNESGDTLVSCGRRETKIWNITIGQQVGSIRNSSDSKILSVRFSPGDRNLLVGTDLRELNSLSLDSIESGWTKLLSNNSLHEPPIADAFVNSPTAIQLNPDLSLLAVAYRGYPLSAYLYPSFRLIKRCRRQYQHVTIATTEWTGVLRIAWHPYSGDILGIYTDGSVFRWHPVSDTYQEVTTEASPSEIHCSPNGAIFATSNVNGSIMLYNFQYFTLIHRLQSEDIVESLCFSPDSLRFYDLRGHHCNVWEPNILTGSSDTEDSISEFEAETRSNVSLYLTEASATFPEPVVALVTRAAADLVCYGDDNGIIQIYDCNTDKRFEVYNSPSGMPIELLCWSGDGRTFAYLEPGNRLTVKDIRATSTFAKSVTWHMRNIAQEKIESEDEITQIILSHDSSQFLSISRRCARLFGVNLQSWVVIATFQTEESSDPPHWISCPHDKTLLLAITSTWIRVFNWADLSPNRTIKFITDTVQKIEVFEKENTAERRGSQTLGESTNFTVANVLASEENKTLSISFSERDNSLDRRVHLFFNLDLEAGESTLIHLPIPERIEKVMERPLGVLGKDKLVFIDRSLWVCTWRLVDKEQESELERHFFIPRDWVTTESLKLCSLTEDGTLFCPRLGEVAVIRTRLRSDF